MPVHITVKSPSLAVVVGVFLVFAVIAGVMAYAFFAPKSTSVTMAEVAQHATADDCYIAYQNNVYDLSWFVPLHKGGNQIVSMCGKAADDFSAIHPGGPFSKTSIQLVLMKSQIGIVAN